MDFRTQIPIPEAEVKIDYRSKVFLVGSCFVENIGAKFEYFQFQHLLNPFGILFHPQAIENFFQRIAQNHHFTENDIFFHNERWQCFEAHSTLSNANSTNLLQQLNSAVAASREFLKNATHIIITPGTAWGYYHKKEEKAVANCHKIPQREFDKVLQSPSEIEESLQKTMKFIQRINSEIQFLFTVSPVRHIKDGFIENQRSKAHLITAIQSLIEQNPKLDYFPSYEIMMDELRDYRFYKEDMLHPSATAVNYIWQRFSETHIGAKAKPTMEEVEKIRKGLAHRAFNPNSAGHQAFLEKLRERVKSLQTTYPHMDF